MSIWRKTQEQPKKHIHCNLIQIAGLLEIQFQEVGRWVVQHAKSKSNEKVQQNGRGCESFANTRLAVSVRYQMSIS